MTSKDHPPFSDTLQQALDGLGIKRPIPDLSFTKEVSNYFADQYAFLQIVATNDIAPLSDPEFITAPSGWVIHNYGHAMSSSPGALLFGKRNIRHAYNPWKEEGDGGEEGGSGTGAMEPGTIYKQAIITAQAMVRLAKECGWMGFRIIDGNALMKFVVWMEANDDGLQCADYKPGKKEYEKRDRIRRSDTEDQVRMRRTFRGS